MVAGLWVSARLAREGPTTSRAAGTGTKPFAVHPAGKWGQSALSARRVAGAEALRAIACATASAASPSSVRTVVGGGRITAVSCGGARSVLCRRGGQSELASVIAAMIRRADRRGNPINCTTRDNRYYRV